MESLRVPTIPRFIDGKVATVVVVVGIAVIEIAKGTVMVMMMVIV